MQFASNLNIRKENSLSILEKNLSICMNANGFSFSITDKNSGKILAIADYNCEFPQTMSNQMGIFRDIFSENDIHSFGFSTIRVVFPTVKHVWVPKELFVEEHKADFLKAVTHLNPSETVFSYSEPGIDMVSVFAISQTLYASLKVLMPLALFESQHTALLKKFDFIGEKKDSYLVLNIRQDEVDILFFDKGKFLFSNVFGFQSETDILYHGLNVVRQLKFQEKEIVCQIAGDIGEDTLSAFQKFIPKTNIISSNLSSEESKIQNNFLLSDNLLITHNS